MKSLAKTKKHISSCDVSETVSMFTANKEQLRLRMVFREITACESWKSKHPELVRIYYKTESRVCPYKQKLIWGVVVPRDAEGTYFLDAAAESGSLHERDLDDGSLTLEPDQQRRMQEAACAEMFSQRGPLNYQVTARDAGLEPGGVSMSSSFQSAVDVQAPAEKKAKTKIGKDEKKEKHNLHKGVGLQVDGTESSENETSEDDAGGLMTGFGAGSATQTFGQPKGKAKAKGKSKAKAKASNKTRRVATSIAQNQTRAGHAEGHDDAPSKIDVSERPPKGAKLTDLVEWWAAKSNDMMTGFRALEDFDSTFLKDAKDCSDFLEKSEDKIQAQQLHEGHATLTENSKHFKAITKLAHRQANIIC